jgi:hypothetical protein
MKMQRTDPRIAERFEQIICKPLVDSPADLAPRELSVCEGNFINKFTLVSQKLTENHMCHAVMPQGPDR